jgi:hypothetical protein
MKKERFPKGKKMLLPAITAVRSFLCLPKLVKSSFRAP